jgi:hypothetical protein
MATSALPAIKFFFIIFFLMLQNLNGAAAYSNYLQQLLRFLDEPKTK